MRVVRPAEKIEFSTGYDSTGIEDHIVLSNIEAYEDHIADIKMDFPTGAVKVGDKVEFTAKVKGAYTNNFGNDINPEGISVLTSEAGDKEEISNFTRKGTEVTDKKGKVKHVFTKPGWYTVGMFNVNDDKLFFTDVYRTTTPGYYPSLYTSKIGRASCRERV